MLERFRAHLRSSGLIPEGSSVLVGYSGGADSTCLLHLMSQLQVDVAAGHLHHGQRSDADKEMALCEALCAEWSIPFVSGKADVPRMAEELKIGLEEAGREARYNFLRNAAFRLQCDLIATAHTRDDLVETVLLNLTRGCGLHGISGIPVKRDNIIRPLLPFSREETRAYCDKHGFWYHDDPANADLSFSRARIRHRVVKELRSVNPGFDVAVERMVRIVGEEDRFLNGMSAAALEQTEVPLNGKLRFLTMDCEVAFDRSKLTSLPAVLFKRSVRLAVEAMGGAIDFRQTELFTEGVRNEERGSVTTEKGEVVLEWNTNLVLIRRLETAVPFRQVLTAPGETTSDEFGWSLEGVPQEGPPSASDRCDLVVSVDLAQVSGQLYFRTAANGDQMQPVGFKGHRKLADLLSEAKLTRAARARLPIICDMLGPIWAPGVCLDARAAAGPASTKVMQLRFGPAKRPKAIMLET